jgi:ABC-type sulfate transport system permease subunit
MVITFPTAFAVESLLCLLALATLVAKQAIKRKLSPQMGVAESGITGGPK